MDEILKIINNIPVILEYFVPGCVFIMLYSFVRCRDEKHEINHLLIKSVIASVILASIYKSIPFIKNISGSITIIVYSGLSALAAYGLGLVLSSKKANSFLYKIGIRRTTETNFWRNAFPAPGQWVYFYEKNNQFRYRGWLREYEDSATEPRLMLSRYAIEHADGELIADHTKTDQILILYTSDARCIEVVPYDPKKKY